jgi:hypothetical protein
MKRIDKLRINYKYHRISEQNLELRKLILKDPSAG